MDFEAFETAMADLEEDTLLEMAEEAAAMGKEGANAAVEACQRGMQTVGERFEEGEYFIGDWCTPGRSWARSWTSCSPSWPPATAAALSPPNSF